MSENELLARIHAAEKGSMPLTDAQFTSAAEAIYTINPEAMTVENAIDLAHARVADQAERELLASRRRKSRYDDIRRALELSWIERLDPLGFERVMPDGSIKDVFAEVVEELRVRAREAASILVAHDEDAT